MFTTSPSIATALIAERQARVASDVARGRFPRRFRRTPKAAPAPLVTRNERPRFVASPAH